MSFTKHKMENRKDFKTLAVIEEHYGMKPVYSNYQRAERHGGSIQKKVNPIIEQMFHLLVTKAKKLFATLPRKEDRVMVELNLKAMPTDSIGMYSILTSTFYFSIECDIMSNYRIEYLFHNCPFEREIMETIARFSLTSYTDECVRVSDYEDYFSRVLAVQPERFITLLDYEGN